MKLLKNCLIVIFGIVINGIMIAILTIIFFQTSGMFEQYKNQTQSDLILQFQQDPTKAVSLGSLAILTLVISAIISGFVTGWLAKKRGAYLGALAGSAFMFWGLLGTILKGTLTFNLLLTIIFILILASISGLVGEKLHARKSNG